MSDATSTAAQPSLHPSNIAAHPGSSWAGALGLLLTFGHQIQAGGLPTDKTGWIQLVGGALFSVLAALGK